MLLLAQALKKRLFLTLASALAGVLFAAVTLWWNAQLSGIINGISEGGTLPAGDALLAVATMGMMCAAGYLRAMMAGYTAEALTHDLRTGYARHFLSLPMCEIETLNAGEQLSKLQNEIADVSGYLSGSLFQMINDGIGFVATLGWLLAQNAGLTLGVNLPVLGIMAYVIYTSRIISEATEHSQQAKGRMNQYADTLLTLFPVIRLYDAAHMMREKYNHQVEAWERQTVRVERLRARLLSLSGFLSNTPLMLLFLIGGGMVLQGSLSLGTLYVFLNLSGNVSGIMMNMPGHAASFRQFSANMNRLSPKIILAGGGRPKWK